MTVDLTLVALTAVLYVAGFYLLLDRSLTRLLLGVVLLGNATNLLLLSAGGPGGFAPVIGIAPLAQMSDPLVQAMILTAIVITLGLVAFVLALIHRNFELGQEEPEPGVTVEELDEVVDDEDDVRIALLAGQADTDDDDERDEPDDFDLLDHGGPAAPPAERAP